MINHIRYWLSARLLNASMRLYPTVDQEITEAVSQFVVDQTADKPIRSEVVEVDDTPLTWQPEQHGNVVIAEPDIMAAHRRGKL